jgi:hypothetical protein
MQKYGYFSVKIQENYKGAIGKSRERNFINNNSGFELSKHNKRRNRAKRT